LWMEWRSRSRASCLSRESTESSGRSLTVSCACGSHDFPDACDQSLPCSAVRSTWAAAPAARERPQAMAKGNATALPTPRAPAPGKTCPGPRRPALLRRRTPRRSGRCADRCAAALSQPPAQAAGRSGAVSVADPSGPRPRRVQRERRRRALRRPPSGAPGIRAPSLDRSQSLTGR
jgi:hypothetical protein